MRKKITVFTTLGGSQNMLVLQRSVPNRSPGIRRARVLWHAPHASHARTRVRAHGKLKGHAMGGERLNLSFRRSPRVACLQSLAHARVFFSPLFCRLPNLVSCHRRSALYGAGIMRAYFLLIFNTHISFQSCNRRSTIDIRCSPRHFLK